MTQLHRDHNTAGLCISLPAPPQVNPTGPSTHLFSQIELSGLIHQHLERAGRRQRGAAVKVGIDRDSRFRRATVDGNLGSSSFEETVRIFIVLSGRGRESTDVGRRHGCPGGGLGNVGATPPGCCDGHAGRVNVDTGPPIGEAGNAVIHVYGAYCDGPVRGCRGIIACVGIAISSCDDESDAFANGVVHGGGHGFRITTTQTHVGNALLAGATVSGNEIDSSDNASVKRK